MYEEGNMASTRKGGANSESPRTGRTDARNASKRQLEHRASKDDGSTTGARLFHMPSCCIFLSSQTLDCRNMHGACAGTSSFAVYSARILTAPYNTLQWRYRSRRCSSTLGSSGGRVSSRFWLPTGSLKTSRKEARWRRCGLVRTW